MINQLRHEARILRKGGAVGRAKLLDSAADEIEKLRGYDVNSFLCELRNTYDGDWSYSSIEDFADKFLSKGQGDNEEPRK